MSATDFVIPAPLQASIPVAGTSKAFPVRRVWCVGRNYLEHIRELGNDERQPPFFFAKHADMIAPAGAAIPYPSLTKDLQHEVEFIVALKSGGVYTYSPWAYVFQRGDWTPREWWQRVISDAASGITYHVMFAVKGDGDFVQGIRNITAHVTDAVVMP